MPKVLNKTFGKNGLTMKSIGKEKKCEPSKKNRKQLLTEGPCLAHYAKDKDSTMRTGLGITLKQKQDDGNTKPIAYGSRYINETEKNIQSAN